MSVGKEWSVMKESRREALVDSLIALRDQLIRLTEAYESGERKWAHGSIAGSIVSTGKAMMLDATSLQDIEGATDWSENFKAIGQVAIREYEGKK